MIFEGQETHIGRVSQQIKLYFQEGKKPPNPKVPKILQEPSIDFTRIWGFSDGAYQGTPRVCGAWAILFLENCKLFFIELWSWT